MDQRDNILGPYYARVGNGRWLFGDRVDAGSQLAASLEHLRGRNPLVIGIARGGVAVAGEVAHRLGAELDVLVARKLGLPGQQELAMGAIASDGTRYVNRELVVRLGVSDASLAYVTRVQSAEALRREQLFRQGRAAKDPSGRIVVLVDDGLATGSTMRVAIRSLQSRRPARLIVAVPVGSPDTCEEIASLVDELVCLYRPERFHAVGQYYRRFDQVEDDEVVDVLRGHSQRRSS